MDNKLQDKSRKEAIVRGEHFNQMIRSEGWNYIKLYFENRVKALATALLVEDKPIGEYERDRQELIGIRKLFGFVDSDIKTLEDANKKNTGTPSE